MGTLTYDPVAFSAVDPSSVDFKMRDQLEHNARIAAVAPFLREAHYFRQKALADIQRVAAYKANLWLDSGESATVWPDDASVAGGSAREAESLAKAQVAGRPAYRQRFYPVPIVISAAQQRQATYGALPLDFEMSRLTTCDQDLTIADVGQDGANRIVKPALDAIKWTFFDKLCWEFRPVIKNEWDANAGVQISAPVVTGDAKEVFTRGGKKQFYRNRPLGRDRSGEMRYWRRNSENGLLLTEKPRVTGAPVCSALSPVEYLIDPSCGPAGMARARYAGDQRVVDAGELFERFVTKENGLADLLSGYAGWTRRLTVSNVEATIWGYRKLNTEGEVENKLILTDFYMRPSPGLGLPQGLHAVFATGLSLDDANALNDGVVLVWESLRWPFDLPYYDDAVEIENAQYYFGDTYARLTGGLNKGLNEMLLYQTMAAARAGKTVSFVAGHDAANDKFDVQHPTEDDTVIASTNPQARMSNVELPNSGALIQANLYGAFLEAMRMVTSDQSPVPPDPDQKATGIRAGLMYAASVAGVVKERSAKAFLRATLAHLRNCQHYLTPKELQAFLPEHGIEELIEFRDAELRYNTVVVLRQTAFFHGNPEQRLAMLARLAQFPEKLLEQVVDLDQLRELVNSRDELGPTERDRQRRRARAETARLVLGPIRHKNSDGKLVVAPDYGVMEIDDDVVHYNEHIKPLEDPQRENLSAEFKRRLLEHAGEHKSRVIQAQQQQLMQQLQLRVLEQKMTQQAAAPSSGGAETAGQGTGGAGQPTPVAVKAGQSAAKVPRTRSRNA